MECYFGSIVTITATQRRCLPFVLHQLYIDHACIPLSRLNVELCKRELYAPNSYPERQRRSTHSPVWRCAWMLKKQLSFCPALCRRGDQVVAGFKGPCTHSTYFGHQAFYVGTTLRPEYILDKLHEPLGWIRAKGLLGFVCIRTWRFGLGYQAWGLRHYQSPVSA